MPYKITEACRACGKCARTCSEHAIKKSGQSYKINTSVCVECGRCMSICPVHAIEPFIETRALNTGINASHNIHENMKRHSRHCFHNKKIGVLQLFLGHNHGNRDAREHHHSFN